MYLITNGIIITEDALLENYDLLVRGNRIERIARRGEIEPIPGMEAVDANGGYIAPGFIDIHSDYIEHMAAPRPTSLFDFRLSLRETEKVLISQGITTMYHSLSIVYNSIEYQYRPIRDPDNVRKLLDLIGETDNGSYLMRHRFHARFEIDNIEQVHNLKNYIAERKVHLVSFMDHTPGQGQYRDLEVYRKKIRGYNDVSDDSIDKLLEGHRAKQTLTVDGMRDIARLARDNGIAIASHDDDTADKLELVRSFGTTISEFPITLDVARQAKEAGMFTVAGAPNVLLGGSHSGNLSAIEGVRHGAIDILCSDYYPASLLHAVFQLARECSLSLPEAVRMVTLNPAKAVRIDREHGSIEEGKRADLLLIERVEPDFPVIAAVWVDGKMIQRTHYRT